MAVHVSSKSFEELPVVKGVIFKICSAHPDYAVGDDGSVWSKRTGKFWKKLSTPVNGSGRPVVIIGGNIKLGGKMYQVHTLVLETFVGKRPEGLVCCHYPDPDPTNNRLTNLRWGTPEQNTSHIKWHGTWPARAKSPRAKLTESQVADIRSLQGFISGPKLAKRYGVNHTCIYNIWNRVTWALPKSVSRNVK